MELQKFLNIIPISGSNESKSTFYVPTLTPKDTPTPSPKPKTVHNHQTTTEESNASTNDEDTKNANTLNANLVGFEAHISFIHFGLGLLPYFTVL